MKKAFDKKNYTKANLIEYIRNNQAASKVELARQLNLSMPTVITNINELVERGILTETGQYESTGGRKAKSLGVERSYCYSAGVDITANHIGMVLVNFGGEVVRQVRTRHRFVGDVTYCEALAAKVQDFLRNANVAEKVLGVGISLPGIINEKERLLVKSHALSLENYSLKMIEQMMPLPVFFENDANAAMMAENLHRYPDSVYLSLNNTLGGAVCMGGQLFYGQNRKAGEFGHMILVPGGNSCYCGKKGCADAYCAASVLTENQQTSLDEFMRRVEEKEVEAVRVWDGYLTHLAILISNLRMAYDTDIILGGDVGGYLPKYMMELGKKVFAYNKFDGDLSYLLNCSYQKEASAVGVAKYFFQVFIEQL